MPFTPGKNHRRCIIGTDPNDGTQHVWGPFYGENSLQKAWALLTSDVTKWEEKDLEIKPLIRL